MGRAAIVYDRPAWSQGQRAAAGGALLAAAIISMWVISLGSRPTPSEPPRPPAKVAAARHVERDPVLQPAPPVPLRIAGEGQANSAATAATKSEVQAAPYRYAGHWRQGPHTALVLSGPGYSIVVRVPGPVDDRFDAVSIDDRRVLLRDRQLQKFVALPMSGGSTQNTVDSAMRAPHGTAETWAAPPSSVRSDTVASPSIAPAVPVVQFGGGRSDGEPEN